MSIQAIAWVLENSEAQLADRLVLLAIANHCDAHGFVAYPSVEQIAVEAGVSRRTVFRSIDQLVRMNELEVSKNRGRGQRNTYRVAYYKRCQDDTVNPLFTVTSCPEKVTSTTIKGVTSGTHNRHEPSGTPAHVRTHAREGIQTWVPTGEREPLSNEQRKANLDRLRAERGKHPAVPEPGWQWAGGDC